MSRITRGVVVAASVLALLALAGVALMAYGRADRGRILAGTQAAGVEIGGMTAAQARAALERRFPGTLRRTVVVRRGRRTFALPPARSHIRADVDGMVHDALARSRRGNSLTRGVRRLFGQVNGFDLPLRVVYSADSVRALAVRVRANVEHAPRPADVWFTGRGLRRRPARPGVRVDTNKLIAAVASRLTAPAGPREVTVPVAITRRPRVTMATLRHRYRWLIGVDRGRKRLRLYHRLRLTHTYPIAVGMVGLRTAAGRYEIISKVVNPPWNVPRKPWAGELAGTVVPPDDPRNPLEARWLGFHDGEGIHGTDDIASLGEAASHGCIRMAVSDVKQLYRRVPLHTPVFIV